MPVGAYQTKRCVNMLCEQEKEACQRQVQRALFPAFSLVGQAASLCGLALGLALLPVGIGLGLSGGGSHTTAIL